jgi:hypothetical protein
MAHGEWVLRNGQFLKNGEYLRSRNGLFTAFMNEDGNFMIGRGDNYRDGASRLWESWWPDQVKEVADNHGKVHGAGPRVAYMSPINRFSIYSGLTDTEIKDYEAEAGFIARRDKTHEDRLVWRCGSGFAWNNSVVLALENDGRLRIHCVDGPSKGAANYITTRADSLMDEEHIQWTKLEYDLQTAVQTPKPRSTSELTAVNDSSIQQDSTLDITYGLITTTGWKHSAGLKIGAKATFEVGVPTVSSNKVEISAEVSYGFEWSKSVTTTDTKTIHLPVKVPPRKAVMGTVEWLESSVRVPFRVKGMGTFASGVTTPISFNGVYEGIASWKVKSHWLEFEPGKEDQARAMLAEGGGNFADLDLLHT